MSCLSREVNSNSELSVLPTNRFFQVIRHNLDVFLKTLSTILPSQQKPTQTQHFLAFRKYLVYKYSQKYVYWFLLRQEIRLYMTDTYKNGCRQEEPVHSVHCGAEILIPKSQVLISQRGVLPIFVYGGVSVWVKFKP